MRWLTLIGILLVICVIINGCNNIGENDSETEDEPEFSLGMEDTEDFDTTELDDLNLDELDNLI